MAGDQGAVAQRRRPTALEALEIYSRSHPETIDQLKQWPFRRFIKAFDSYQRGLLVQEWTQRKIAHMAALHSGNVDLEKSKDAISRLEDSYDEAIATAWNGPRDVAAEEAALAENPFARASRRQLGAMGMRLPGEDQVAALA